MEMLGTGFILALTVIPQPVNVTEGCGETTNLTVRSVRDASIPAEGYRLEVTADGAVIASSDEAGAFYANETLRQLTQAGRRPIVRIADAPAYPWRGVLLDDCRHFFGKETVKRTLDLMARYKLNRFHWHLTDDQGWRIEVPGYPELVKYATVRSSSPLRGKSPKKGEAEGLDGVRYGPFYYTEADLREIVTYAAERHIEIVPEIDLPGHMFAALAAYPEFGCVPENMKSRSPRVVWGVEEDVLCLGNDKALRFVEDVLAYVCRVFPGKTIHIGGDECPRTRWKSCAKCQARVASEGLDGTERLQPWMTKRAVEFLARKGRRAIVWDEGLLGDIPASAMVMHWRDWYKEGDADWVSPAAAARQGHDLILTPSKNCYLSCASQDLDDDPFPYGPGVISLEKCQSFDPGAFVPPAECGRVRGGQACIWSEGVWNAYDLEWKLWPRACGLAEAFWSGRHRTRYDDFRRRMAEHRRRLCAEGVNAAPMPEGEGLCSYVDPFIGTAGTGHTHPAASFPFGMVQAGPDTGRKTWEYCSGYQFGDTNVLGYSQDRLSGTGCPDLGDVLLLPFVGGLGPRPASRRIDKSTEIASPGFYSVVQPDDGIKVEITAGPRTAAYRFITTASTEVKVLVDLTSMIDAPWAKFGNVSASVSPVGKREIRGELMRDGWIVGRKICFSLEFDADWVDLRRLPSVDGDPAPAFVALFAPGREILSCKIGLSVSSSAAARRNRESDMPGWDFAGRVRRTRQVWERLLHRSRAEGDGAQLKNWYSALYHLYLQPMNYADVGDEPYMTTLSLWDTYRAAHPWYTLATPEIVTPCIRSMLKVARVEGKLPVMSYGGKYIECMIGNHAIPVIVDAHLKGFGGFDVREALTRMTNSVTVVHGKGKAKEDWDVLARYGYYPFDLVPSESVSRTLECAYDDWCIARFAESIGEKDVAARFDARSKGWQHVIDPECGFARGKDSAGRWRSPFNPFALGGGEERLNDFTEGNAFQWTWSVPQDITGLMAALGGREKFVEKIDALFSAPRSAAGMGERLDVTGLVGQYAHGNEPSHHVAYLYALAGRPEKTADRVREICERFYRPTPGGLCGNDDCGQMSAWYVFSALGFYPVNPCGGEYVIGAPQLPRMTLAFPRGNVLVVRADNLSDKNKYVRTARLNGQLITDGKIRQADLLAGGVLTFEMYSGGE